jgi:hypothetical protein
MAEENSTDTAATDVAAPETVAPETAATDTILTDTAAPTVADGETVLTADPTPDSENTDTVLSDVKDETDSATSDVPDTYADFTLPEGFGINPEYMSKLAPALKELGMTQDAAQKLITAHVEGVQASEGARTNAFTQLKQDWLDQAKADETIGGDKWDTTVKHARAALETFGTPELNQLLKDYGIGNNPELLRIFSKVGVLLQEDTINTEGTKIVPEKTIVDRMYPNQSS